MWHLLDLYNPWMGRVVGRILDAERPDLVHTHNIVGFSGAVWQAAKRRGLPLVHTIHDYSLLCANSGRAGFLDMVEVKMASAAMVPTMMSSETPPLLDDMRTALDATGS